jgi:hypothetical protein
MADYFINGVVLQRVNADRIYIPVLYQVKRFLQGSSFIATEKSFCGAGFTRQLEAEEHTGDQH